MTASDITSGVLLVSGRNLQVIDALVVLSQEIVNVSDCPPLTVNVSLPDVKSPEDGRSCPSTCH